MPLREGLKSKGDIIICTDADCEMGGRWIQTIVNYFEDSNCKFISAQLS